MRDLTVAHDQENLLRVPQFAIEPAQRLALVGASGVGKSLMCQALLGLLPRVAPELRVSGRIAWRSGVDKKVGYVPQGTVGHLHPAYSVRQQVRQLLEHRTIDCDLAYDTFLENLQALLVPDPTRLADHFPEELSGGLSQRVLLALALASRPSLLVLDEAISALDGLSRAAALAWLLRQTGQLNCALLFVTHQEPDATLLGCTILRLSEGCLTNSTPQVSRATTLVVSDSTTPTKTKLGYDDARPILMTRDLGIALANGIPLIKDCSITVRQGQSLGVLGESGSGKTTLLRSLCGLIPPSHGEIYFDGNAIRSLDSATKRHSRRYFQFLSQDPRESLNPYASVAELFAEPAHIHGFRHPDNDLIAAALNQLGIDFSSVAHRLPRQLSFGQQQRIALVRAIVAFPDLKLLILDEPVSGLDEINKRRVIDFLATQYTCNSEWSMIVASHDLLFLEITCDLAIILRRGILLEEWITKPWGYRSAYSRLYHDASYAKTPSDIEQIGIRLDAMTLGY
ncbi:MAG: ATP-binding cassette domain-containing protein [Pseudomonadota bacterium]